MKIIAVVFLCLVPVEFGIAQGFPRGEVFGGYSYLHIDTQGVTGTTLDNACNQLFGSGTCPAGTFGVHQNFNGWNAAAEVNANRWLGVKADLSGHYGTPVTLSENAIAFLNGLGISGLPPKANSFSYLFGPVVSQRFNKYTVFGHALVGANRAAVNLRVKVNQVQIPALTVSNTALGMAFGGGVDMKVSPHFAIRGQADYLYTGHDFSGVLPGIAAHQNNVRASVGIVYRFGDSGVPSVAPRTVENSGTSAKRDHPSASRRSGLQISSLGLIVIAGGNDGAEIKEIAPGSVTELAGLHVGDVINAVDGKTIKTPMELEAELSNRGSGTKIRLGYMVRGYWQSETIVILK